jgi:hypothetical protein
MWWTMGGPHHTTIGGKVRDSNYMYLPLSVTTKLPLSFRKT